jgi:UDP-glucose 4-epimerase
LNSGHLRPLRYLILILGGKVTKALVTGAAGFIGSHVARHLVDTGIEVVALDNLSGGFMDNVPAGARWVRTSVTDYPELTALFNAEGFDYVYHMAAYAAEGLSHFIRRYNYETNMVGSVNLINLSVLHRVKCFVFTSSIAVYGANQLPMTEALTPQPEDPYGISKYAVELDLAAARRQFGLDYIIFRPHNVYGEHQNIGDKYRNVIGIFMNQVLQDQPLTIFGDGEQSRAFSYIDDVAPVIAGSVQTPAAYGQVFNVGGDRPYTVNELAQTVCETLGVAPNLRHLPARQEVQHAYASHDKVRSFFELPEPVDLRTGLARMASWVLQVGSRRTKDFANIEIPIGLPAGW